MLIDLKYKFININTMDYIIAKEVIKKESLLLKKKFYVYDYLNGGFFGNNTSIYVDINTSLKSIYDKLNKNILNNSIFFINNLNRYLNDNNLQKFSCNIEQLFLSDFKNNKLIINGTLHSLPKEIIDIFIPINIEEEIRNIKDEFYKKELKPILNGKIINYKQMSLTELINIAAIIKEKDDDAYSTYINRSYSIIHRVNNNEIDFNNVGNFKELKEYFRDIKTAITSNNIAYPKRILITGKSGVGKTMFAKASANYLDLPLYRVDLSVLFDKFLGNTEKNMDILWKELYDLPLSIILFDEIEKMLSGGSSSDSSDAGTTARAMSKFLYNLQEYNGNAIIIGTVNNINALSKEYFREKRWDKIYIAITNDIDTLETILKNYKVKYNIHNVKKLYDILSGNTGAYIDNVISNIIFHLKTEKLPITIENIIKEV